MSLIRGGASSTSTADTLHVLLVLQLGSRHAADARGLEIRLLGLHAPQAAQLQ